MQARDLPGLQAKSADRFAFFPYPFRATTVKGATGEIHSKPTH